MLHDLDLDCQAKALATARPHLPEPQDITCPWPPCPPPYSAHSCPPEVQEYPPALQQTLSRQSQHKACPLQPPTSLDLKILKTFLTSTSAL